MLPAVNLYVHLYHNSTKMKTVFSKFAGRLGCIIAYASVAMMVFPYTSSAVAQDKSVPVDTLAESVGLGEVVVQAPKVIHKADMDVLFPSKSAISHSQNAMGLLNHLMIPTLNVNEMAGSVKSGGEDVEIRINGRLATVDQLQTIDPSTVKRIEWIDNPGVRYDGANAVLNVVVSNPTVGGSFMAQGMQALTQPWGNGYADLKLNSGRSQWSVGFQGRYTNHVDTYREYEESFTYSDGTSVTRTESPLSGYVSQTNLRPRLAYSYINPDKTVVWVEISANKSWPMERSNTGRMSLSNSPESVILYERESTSGTTPRFNAYIEQSLPSSQTIAIDLNTSVFNGRSTHDYVETDEATGEIMTDTYTSIKDCNRTLSAELDYVKRWNRSRLTAGVRYSMARNRATRESGSVTRQYQDRTYMFAEYFQQVSKVSLTGGLGAQYLDQRTRHTGKGTFCWSFRPRFSASYRLARSSQFRLNFSTWQTTPSLSQTNATPQQIDGFQYQVGNPDLKAYNNYRAAVQYNFNFPKVTGRFEARWTRSPHQIAPYMEWKDDNLLTYFENSRGLTAWRFSFAPQIEIIPSVLTAKGSLKYYMAKSSGRGYVHKCHNWSGDVSLLAYYGNFSFMANYEVNPATLSGETISTGERTSTIALSYKWKGFMATAGMLMPFNHYSMQTELLNRYNSNRNVLRSKGFDRMPLIQVAYNFNWGRQKRDVSRIIDGEDDLQQSKAAGR